MEKVKFKFGDTFERIIVREIIAANPSYLMWLEHLKADYFMSPSVGYIYSLILKAKKESEIIPTFYVLRRMIRDDKAPTEGRVTARLEYLREIRKVKYKPADVVYILKRLAAFIKRQRYIATIGDSLVLLKDGSDSDIEKLDSLFKDICSQDINMSSDTGLWYFRDIRNRLFRQFEVEKRYKLLIPEIDHNLRHGGMVKGETIFWLASLGTGKTMALCYNTKAWLLQKLKGVYYTFQLMPEDISERLDSSFSGIASEDIRDNLKKIQAKTEALKARYGDSLIIKYFPRGKHSMASVKNHIRTIRDQGFNPDFIALDFLNNMVSEKQSVYKDSVGSKYYEGGDISAEVIAFCQEEKLLGCTGVQANRVGMKEEVVTAANIAESLKGAMEATLMVSINRNAQERQADRARLFVAKYTYGKDQYIIPIQTNYDMGSFYRRG